MVGSNQWHCQCMVVELKPFAVNGLTLHFLDSILVSVVLVSLLELIQIYHHQLSPVKVYKYVVLGNRLLSVSKINPEFKY
jgi:hypothetical protein